MRVSITLLCFARTIRQLEFGSQNIRIYADAYQLLDNSMGNKGSDAKARNKQEQAQIMKEFAGGFEKYKNNPTYLIQLFTQIPLFAKNITSEFPKAQTNFDAYYQMIAYLKGEDKKYEINQYAVSSPNTYEILDRFLLLATNIKKQQFEKKVVGKEQLDEIVCEYFKIFVENPEKNTIGKLYTYMSLKQQTMKIRDFTQQFVSYFRNSTKYLKDFYNKKFKKLQKNGRLLSNFTSKIIKNDAILLALKIPRLTEPQIFEMYNIQKHGTSFHSIQKALFGYTGPWLLLIEHIEKNKQGVKQQYIFGAYQNGPIREVNAYQGDLTGFLFSLHPHLHYFTPQISEKSNKFFYINNISNSKFNKRRGIGFGGNQQKQKFKLWIDEDIDKSYVTGGRDQTYGSGNLASPGTEQINIKRIEIWALGHKFNHEDQKNYRIQRQEQILRRRKVDKKQFLGQNAGLFMQKTFAHREQVIGQIQKPQKKQEEEK